MFGALLRAGPLLIFTTLVAGVLAWIMQYLLQPLAAAEGAQDSMLYQSLAVFTDFRVIVIIGGLTIFIGVLYTAVVDSGPGVAR